MGRPLPRLYSRIMMRKTSPHSAHRKRITREMVNGILCLIEDRAYYAPNCPRKGAKTKEILSVKGENQSEQTNGIS